LALAFSPISLECGVSWIDTPTYPKILHRGLLKNEGFGSLGRMHLVQTFSYFLASASPVLALKTFRCRKQAGPLHRKQRPPSGVANSREQTEQRHLMDSQVTTFDTEVIRSPEPEPANAKAEKPRPASLACGVRRSVSSRILAVTLRFVELRFAYFPLIAA